MALGLACLGTLFCGGVVAYRVVSAWGCRMASLNGLQQLKVAMEVYHQKHGCYPPQYLTDKAGRPAHSWRVLIWPYLSVDDSWKRYRFDEPWDGPHNRLLMAESPACFRSPNADRRQKSSFTDYVGIAGDGTPWCGSRSLRQQDLSDWSKETIWFVEVANSGIHWTEPRDIPIDQALLGINVPGGIQSDYPDMLPVQMIPCGVNLLPAATTPDVLRTLLTTVSEGKDKRPETASPIP